MRKLKIFRILSVIMIMALVMSACSSSDKDNKSNDSSKDSGSVSSSTDDKGSASNNEKKDDSSGTSSNEADDGGKVNSGDKDNSGGNSSTLDLGDLDSDTLKPMPEEKSPSMYYYNAKEISSDTFFPDQEDILGKPFYFNGTILEEFDSITDYFQMNEFGKIISGLDASSVGYKIMTKYGNVIVIDFTPYLIKYVKDNLDSNVMGLKYYKCWYNDLAKYKTMPETGDTARFYGLYYGYSMNDECPVFTYGVSNLAHDPFFGMNYIENRSDEVKKAKYRNLITFSYPVGWSDTLDNGGQIEIYYPDNKGVLVIRDYENEDMSLDDTVKMLLGEDVFMMEPEDIPEGEFPEDEFPDFDISDYIKVHEKEKVAIGDGSINAYKLNLSVRSNDDTWDDELVYAFQAKRSIMVLDFIFYDYEDLSLNTDDLDANIDYTDDEDNSSELTEENDSSDTDSSDDVNDIIREEISNIIKSLEICGF